MTLGHILVVAFVEGALGVLLVLLVGSLRGADRHRQAAPLRVEISQGAAPSQLGVMFALTSAGGLVGAVATPTRCGA